MLTLEMATSMIYFCVKLLGLVTSWSSNLIPLNNLWYLWYSTLYCMPFANPCRVEVGHVFSYRTIYIKSDYCIREVVLTCSISCVNILRRLHINYYVITIITQWHSTLAMQLNSSPMQLSFCYAWYLLETYHQCHLLSDNADSFLSLVSYMC